MSFKRMKFTDSIDEARSSSKHAAIAVSLGREIRVLVNPTLSTSPGTSSSSNAQPQVLKTQKIREAEEAALGASLTKATIRVRFPDDYILEACFHPSEKIHSLYDLLSKVIARPDIPFYVYTTPPKEIVKDMFMDFYTAKFVPGAIVYFCYEPRDGSNPNAYRCLRGDIISLYGFNIAIKPLVRVYLGVGEPVGEPVKTMPSLPEPKPVTTKATKPKWFKL